MSLEKHRDNRSNDTQEPSVALRRKRFVRQKNQLRRKRYLEKKKQTGMSLSDEEKGRLAELNEVFE